MMGKRINPLRGAQLKYAGQMKRFCSSYIRFAWNSAEKTGLRRKKNKSGGKE